MSELGPRGIDVHAPNVARVYDYLLGGKDNFAADREAAGRILKAFPEAREGARMNRMFLGSVVHHLAAREGVGQFLDIGTGLPTQSNVHEVAHGVAPGTRTVYVDHDSVVCAHGRALLAGAPTVSMVQADLRDTADLYDKIRATRLIDFDQPVAVLLVAVLHFLEDPEPHVAALREWMAPGSFLVISHMTRTEERGADTDAVTGVYSRPGSGLWPRTVPEIRRFLGDFDLIDASRFVGEEAVSGFAVLGWGGVGRKPA
ncbi:S-adenosyl methyltransferase [Sinosporangium album]|uniref:S-adenosyl methyltransferase n=1 Tax=Sinosporangium album TaxID=504805 RepID=A0A1G7V2K1_9ACTN|nr:SAM-dependent methyltransferase [Sinosporangium album]SDG53190.1 S-adenosyl methyltransferase [Sinosporangium album]